MCIYVKVAPEPDFDYKRVARKHYERVGIKKVVHFEISKLDFADLALGF